MTNNLLLCLSALGRALAFLYMSGEVGRENDIHVYIFIYI